MPLKEEDGRGYDKMNNMKDKLKYGGFSIAITILVIIAVLAVNILATYVENNNGLRVDFTPTRSYTLDRTAEAAIKDLGTDVIIYTFIPKGQASEFSTYTQNIAAMFDGASDKITYVNVDPIVNPSKLQQFSSDIKKLETFSVVICEKDNEINNYQAFNESELYEYNSTTMKRYFVLQRIITSALIYMRTGVRQNVYILTGHGENVNAENTQIMKNRISRENCNVQEIDLLAGDRKLQQGDILVVLEPTSDLSKEEYEIIRSFLADSYGRMLFLCSKLVDDGGQPLTNYRNLLDNFHITLNDGFVAETNNKNHLESSKQIKLVADQTHDISKSVRSANEPVYVNEATSYSYNYNTDISTGTHTETFTNVLTSYQTSVLVPWDKSNDFVVEDYQMGINGIGCAYERTNTSISGTLATTTTRILLFGSESLATGEYLGNSNILRNGINWLAGREAADAIVSVGMSIDLTDHYVQLTQFQTQTWFVVLVVVVPAVIFLLGVAVWIRRKNL